MAICGPSQPFFLQHYILGSDPTHPSSLLLNPPFRPECLNIFTINILVAMYCPCAGRNNGLSHNQLHSANVKFLSLTPSGINFPATKSPPVGTIRGRAMPIAGYRRSASYMTACRYGIFIAC